MGLLTKVGISRMIVCIPNKSQQKQGLWGKGKHEQTVCLEEEQHGKGELGVEVIQVEEPTLAPMKHLLQCLWNFADSFFICMRHAGLWKACY